MNREQWQQLQELFHRVVQLDSAERSAFLDHHCCSDRELRQELEQMLAAESELNASFLEGPALQKVARDLSTSSMPPVLPCGTRLGPYEIMALIGAGGMGQVYRARDTRLHRSVAIKIVSQHFAADPQRHQRFEREARAISSLQHPNICTLHDVGSQDGTDYLVMEHLEGETLAARLLKGRLPVDLALRYASEIADALDTAHRRGIVHRDLKPGNIFITTHGESKVLDFGLAKLEETGPPAGTSNLGAYDPKALTTPGLAMGTVAYMSPEQAQGKELDRRTDVFSLGAVLYEMATGRMAFPGNTLALVFKAILEETPPAPTEVEPSLPPQLDRVVVRAMEKKPDLRYQSAADLRTDLKRLKRDTESGKTSPVALKRETRKLAPGARWVLAATLTVATAAVAAYVYLKPGKLTDQDRIVIADFSNSTGDPVFDDTLKAALTVSLRQSPFLNVLPDGQVAKILQQMKRPAGAKLTPDLAPDLCQRAGSKAYIGGAIGSLGSEYVLGLKAVNCQNGDTLAQEQVTAESKEKVLNALGQMAKKLREELGESLGTVQRFDVPLAQATTSSLDALKAYSLGKKSRGDQSVPAALVYSQRAIELDSNFAMAYSAVGGDYASLGETARAAEYYSKAFQLREHASERERLVISADYYSNVTGEVDKGAQIYQEEIDSYPREPSGYIGLSMAYAAQGQYEKAAEVARHALRLTPERLSPYANLANFALALQHFDESRAIIHDAQARKLDDGIPHLELYSVAFVKADSAGMAEQEQWFSGRDEYENYGLALASDTEAYAGHLRKARELSARAVESAVRTDQKEVGAIYLANAAVLAAAYGEAAQARQAATRALRLSAISPGPEAEVALAFAMVGDGARAQTLAKDLDKRFPLDTQMQHLWLPAIKAQLALYRKSPALALRELGSATAIEFGNIPYTNNLSCLYHVYVRGQAYLAAGQGSSAAGEFQKIVDHSGMVANCWTGALAHLGLGRANVLESKSMQGADADAARVRALAAYRDFLTLWKDADADIPVLREAKAEYAKLQQ
jgi:eukaryotic-like serine/threonine-protein kinase